ncbi:MAG: glycosyltransferase family 2 protein, partial [Haloechinothrix sp.]
RYSGHNHSRAIARYESDRSSLDMGRHPAAVRPMSRVSYVPSAALVVRRSALSTLGGFDEALRYGEDVDLVWRLIASGATVRYQPESVVWHQPRANLRSWLRQRFDYGTSAAPLSMRHRDQLSCARISRWSAAAWGLAAMGAPVAGLAVAGITASLLPRKLRDRGVPILASLGLAGRGHLGAGGLLADATRRAWWPLALLSKRGRVLLLAGLLPIVIDAVSRQHELDRLRWALLRIADDLAYGAGVWAGCLRHRTAAPLLPRFTGKSR